MTKLEPPDRIDRAHAAARRAWFTRLWLLLPLAAAGCGWLPTDPSPRVDEITRLPRALSAAEVEVIGASNQFAFGLLEQANHAHANLFLSPLSASMALGMTMNGAAGETWNQMRDMLGFGGLAEEEINAAYESLLELLVGLDPSAETAVGNSVWTRQGFPVHADFLAAVRETFDAEVAELDFASPSASGRINGWVNAATKGRIEDIVPAVIPGDVVMYLINAIYFKAPWTFRFEPSDTRTEPFHLDDGSARTVPLMSMRRDLPYQENDRFQAVDLPYGGSAFSMTVLLPRPEVSADDLAASLDATQWQDITDSFHETDIEVFLPALPDGLRAYAERRPGRPRHGRRVRSPGGPLETLTGRRPADLQREAEVVGGSQRRRYRGGRRDRGLGGRERRSRRSGRPALPLLHPGALFGHHPLRREGRKPTGGLTCKENTTFCHVPFTGAPSRAARLLRRQAHPEHQVRPVRVRIDDPRHAHRQGERLRDLDLRAGGNPEVDQRRALGPVEAARSGHHAGHQPQVDAVYRVDREARLEVDRAVVVVIHEHAPVEGNREALRTGEPQGKLERMSVGIAEPFGRIRRGEVVVGEAEGQGRAVVGRDRVGRPEIVLVRARPRGGEGVGAPRPHFEVPECKGQRGLHGRRLAEVGSTPHVSADDIGADRGGLAAGWRGTCR